MIKEEFKLDNQLCFRLYTASRLLTQAYHPLLSAAGLTYPQYLVLLVLWEQDGIPVSEICRRLHLDNGTVSPLLKKLEKEGLLEKSRSPEDERVVHITLTEAGRALQERAKEIPGKVGSCVRLTPGKALTLYQLLYELLDEEEIMP